MGFLLCLGLQSQFTHAIDGFQKSPEKHQWQEEEEEVEKFQNGFLRSSGVFSNIFKNLSIDTSNAIA